MKIDHRLQNLIPPPQAAALKKPAAMPVQDAQPAKPGGSAFSVMLSTAVEKSAAPVQDDDAKRQARVAAIRDQLAAGTYNISGKDVANKILKALKG